MSSKTVPIRTASCDANAPASELDLRISEFLRVFFVVNQATPEGSVSDDLIDVGRNQEIPEAVVLENSPSQASQSGPDE